MGNKTLFKKKFKLRIKPFTWTGQYFTLQYSYGYFFTEYYNICEFHHYGWDSNLERWKPKLMSYEEAEKLAATIKSYEDIVNLYKKEELEESEFYKNKELMLSKRKQGRQII